MGADINRKGQIASEKNINSTWNERKQNALQLG